MVVGRVGGVFAGVVREEVGQDAFRGARLRAYGDDAEGWEEGESHREGVVAAAASPALCGGDSSIALWSQTRRGVCQHQKRTSKAMQVCGSDRLRRNTTVAAAYHAQQRCQ